MKKIYLYFFLIVVFTSCFHDTDLSKSESIHKAAVIDYLDRIKSNTAEENISKIDALESALDFRNVKTIKSPLGQRILVVPVSSLENVEAEFRKAIFYLNYNSTIDYSQIIGIDPQVENFSSGEALIDDILNNRSLSFTGKFSVYSVYQDLMFFNSFDNGKINVNGKVRPGEAKSGGGRTNGCTAWYLTTTYFYSDGSRTTTTEYLGTTCDCEQNSTRSSSTMCGGGQGGSGGAGLPGNPTPGTLVQVTLSNGVMHLMEWQCDDAHCFWADLGVTVPDVVVETNRPTYYFLPIDPVNGQFILGPDGMSYTYNAAYMNWVGVKNVENNVTTPCLKAQIDRVINNDVIGDIQKIFNDVFNNSDNISMLSFTESPSPGYPARTFPVSPGASQFTTDLNTSVLSLASNEYTTITLYHEIVHAILLNQGGGSQLSQHQAILEKYIDQIVQATQSLYPSLPTTDGRAIAMAGLADVAKANPSLFDDVAKKYGLTRAQIAEIAKSYRRDNVAGNVKKGTPCS